jgi:hypothetical protein
VSIAAPATEAEVPATVILPVAAQSRAAGGRVGHGRDGVWWDRALGGVEEVRQPLEELVPVRRGQVGEEVLPRALEPAAGP